MTKVMGWVVLGLVALAGMGRAAENETPRVRWDDKVFPAFEKALTEKKLLVVYFRNDFCAKCEGPCKHCAVIDAIVRGKEVGTLADRAVWVWQTVGQDDAKKNVEKLMKELNITGVPAV